MGDCTGNAHISFRAHVLGGTTSSLPSGPVRCYGRHEDNRKVQFMLDALDRADPFAENIVIPVDIERAIEWQSVRSPQQAMADREKIISSLERKAYAFR